MSEHLQTGKAGERIAKAFLEKKGFKVLAQNYRSAFGELDLVCKEKGSLVFVEVKTRRTGRFGEGLEAVDLRKREKILKTALYFLRVNKLDNSPYRFDVISIGPGNPQKIDHIEHAFP